MTPSLSETLRPRDFADLVQPQHMVDRLERMADERQLMNMLFYGQPGIGKTSAARILLSKLGADPYEVNGSVETGINAVRDDLVAYCRTGHVFGLQKACFIDECEYLSSNAQAGLRGVIEQSQRVPFLLTANDIRKLHPALKSRCLPICFDPNPLEAKEIVERLFTRYRTKLDSIGLDIGDDDLRKILYTEFPDFRRVANRIEFEAQSTPTSSFQMEQPTELGPASTVS